MWSTKGPTSQGWYWYRANSHCHAVPTFVEDCGRGVFIAVSVYQKDMVRLTDLDVEWFSKRIEQPK